MEYRNAWSFDRFLVLIVSTITLYISPFFCTADLSEAEEHQRRFQRNRTGYYSAFISMCVLDIAQTAIHGDLLESNLVRSLYRSLRRPGGHRSPVRIDGATIVSLRGIN